QQVRTFNYFRLFTFTFQTSRVPTPVFIGVNDIGVHVINASTKIMLQSFNYKDIEWSPKEQAILEIKPTASNKGGMHLFTKQATLITYLTRTLDHVREEKRKSEELKKRIQFRNATIHQQQLSMGRHQKRDAPADRVPVAPSSGVKVAVDGSDHPRNVIGAESEQTDIIIGLGQGTISDTDNKTSRRVDGYLPLSDPDTTIDDDLDGDC
ncbi:hypothetical protein LSH36_730g01057, partial [Paralvinella palmiformis]